MALNENIVWWWHRDHTLVLTDVRRIYSFGCQEQGQLGHREESHPFVPLPVLLPQGDYMTAIDGLTNEHARQENHSFFLLTFTDTSNCKIGTIFAGENCSFATCSSDEVTLLKGAEQPTVEEVWRYKYQFCLFRWQEIRLDANADSRKIQPGLEGLIDKWTSECDSKSWKKIKQCV